jgi:hypothetical protein
VARDSRGAGEGSVEIGIAIPLMKRGE